MLIAIAGIYAADIYAADLAAGQLQSAGKAHRMSHLHPGQSG